MHFITLKVMLKIASEVYVWQAIYFYQYNNKINIIQKIYNKLVMQKSGYAFS